MPKLLNKILKRRIFISILAGMAIIPVFVFAASTDIRGIFGSLTLLVANRIIPILGGICFAIFIVGIIRFIAAAGNPEQIQKSKYLLIWGLVGLVTMLGIYGIIQILLLAFLGVASTPSPSGVWPFRAFP